MAVAAVAAALPAAPARAAGSTYVALGDSFSSGTGTRTYVSDGTSCQRSVYAYPALLAASWGSVLDFRACSGATTADVAAVQLGTLGAGTTHVTLTVGGNDAGFADVLTECAMPSWASDCGAAIDRALAVVDGPLPARLDGLYAAVRRRAPQARFVVGGYPRLFNGTDCNSLTWFSATEMSRLNAVADRLNTRIATAAGRAGAVFSSASVFVGHAVCSSTAWLNGLSHPISESYHPNRSGHSAGYAPLIGDALTGAPVTVDPATVQRAVASAPQLAMRQRSHAAQDRRIVPKRFVLPDLRSARVRAAAARAGVDLRSRLSIDRADARHDARQARVRRAGVR